MSETTKILPSILLRIGQNLPFVRLFQNNTGMGWTGDAVRKGNDVHIRSARPLHAGLTKGSSDLIGWTTVEITPEMVGRKVAIFTAVEVKSAKGRATPEQVNFINVVNSAGGIAFITNNPDDAENTLKILALSGGK